MKRATFCGALILCLILATHAAIAQQAVEDNPFEVGGQVTGIKLAPLESFVTIPDQIVGGLPVPGRIVRSGQFGIGYFGIGGRLSYNFNSFLSIEAEGNYFPKPILSQGDLSRKAQFLAGLKVGARTEKFGVFVKARPGLMYFSSMPSHRACDTSPITGEFTCIEEKQTNFAFDAGGVVEYYPSPRTIIRFDLGDTIVRFKEVGPTQISTSSIFTPANTTHSFQFSIGFSLRF